MKTKAISSLFVLFALVAGTVAMTPAAFADHSEVTITPAAGSGVKGCEETPEGCYTPMVATVDVGGVVIMSNDDTAAHTFTAGTAKDGPSGTFDSGLVISGQVFNYSPDTVGEIPYFCIVHPWMAGMIIVQEVEADDGDMMDGDNMMKDVGYTGMLSDGTTVSLMTSKPTAGERMEIYIEFSDQVHANYDILAMQSGQQVLEDEGVHSHDATGTHQTKPLDSSDPVEVTIIFNGYGIKTFKGPIGEQVVFSNIIPEFGTIAMMILVVAIISIIAVTAKSRVVPKF